jgi:hypothetical protein
MYILKANILAGGAVWLADEVHRLMVFYGSIVPNDNNINQYSLIFRLKLSCLRLQPLIIQRGNIW